MSEQKDRFGLTEKRREELLAEIPTIGQRIKDAAIREADYGRAAFLVDLYRVAKAVLSPTPLDEPVDFPTAMRAAADGHDVRYYIGANTEPFVNYVKWKDFRFRILPKTTPQPEPKWISAEEAAVALLCKRQAVRCKPPGKNELLTWWYVADGDAVHVRNKHDVFIKTSTHMNEFTPGSQWCIVNSETGEAIETNTPD